MNPKTQTTAFKRAWLIAEPHPDVAKRRVITRRLLGRSVRLYRVPVTAVRVIALLPTLGIARIRDHTGSEYYGRFDRLASTRPKFAERIVAIAAVPEGGAPRSGAPNVPSDETASRLS